MIDDQVAGHPPANARPLRVAAAWEHWLDALGLGAVLATLGTILQPELLLTATLPAGGDTPSHYATAVYLRDALLPNWRLSGWASGNYAGFPILQFYFPLSFLVMILLGTALPFTVAFKLGTVVGTFALPLSIYSLVRLLGFRFPTPVLAAGATTVFLLQGGNSMWGGNIQSTLAGEFAFSLGFALTFLFLGTMWVGVRADRGAVANGVLLACVGLAHGYTLLFAGFSVLVLPAIVRNHWRGIRYLVIVYGLAFCLLAAWLLPLLANLPYTTAFAPAWFIASWTEILPKTFWPPAVLAVVWTVWVFWKRIQYAESIDGAVVYLWYGLGISASGYLLGPWLHVVDVRFIPFGQILLVLLAALALGELGRSVRWSPLLTVLAMAALIAWSINEAPQLSSWIRWNYSGLEQKPLWQSYREVNQVLEGSANDPRVVYEHSTMNNSAGSPRMFESLPLFSGRSTLEGLYLQASPTAPFVFYLQAELSKEASCPFTHVACTRFQPAHALRHLDLFNVREIIAVSEELKAALRKREDVVSIAKASPYEIFRIRGDDREFRYVEPLSFEPLLVRTPRWKDVAYQWFRLVDQIDVHLVFPVNAHEEELQRFQSITSENLIALPHRALDLPSAGPVVSKLSRDTIDFDTPYLGHPHLIKVSYHPNWHVEGARTIYVTSPSFMLVYPETQHVRLWYGSRWPERVGAILTGAALLSCGWLSWSARRRRAGTFALSYPPLYPPLPSACLEGPSTHGHELAGTSPVRGAASGVERLGMACGYVAAGLPFVLLIVASVLRLSVPVPDVLLNAGIQARDRGELDKAEGLLRRALEGAPASGVGEQAAYYLAIVQFLRGDMEGTVRLFQDMIRLYPTSPFVPEGYYHIGLAHLKAGRTPQARTVWEKVVQEFHETAWAKYAQDRLAELPMESHVDREADRGATPVRAEASSRLP